MATASSTVIGEVANETWYIAGYTTVSKQRCIGIAEKMIMQRGCILSYHLTLLSCSAIPTFMFVNDIFFAAGACLS